MASKAPAIAAAAVAAATRPEPPKGRPAEDAASDVATHTAKIARSSYALLRWEVLGALRREPRNLLLATPPPPR